MSGGYIWTQPRSPRLRRPGALARWGISPPDDDASDVSLVGKSDSTGSVRYLLDGSTIIAAYDPGSGARLAVYNQNPERVDEVFSYKSATGPKYYPHTDMLGSVYALSDSMGKSQAAWTYDVYGTRTQTSGTLTYDAIVAQAA